MKRKNFSSSTSSITGAGRRNSILTALMTGLCLVWLGSACNRGKGSSGGDQSAGGVPVTLTSVKTGELFETVELNATSQFQLKTSVKAVTGGYLQEVGVRLGQLVSGGDRLFVIRSREAQSLGNTLSKADTSLRFSGRIVVKSPGSGYILQLAYREGDYVQDGETLAILGDKGSLVFQLELPYELKPFLDANRSVTLSLPDGQQLKGQVTSSMPTVDAASQTQGYIIRTNQSNPLPENLVAKVKFVRKVSHNAMILPKEAILTNEVQSEFWIMQMIDANTAVRVPVVRGIESGDSVEIVSPRLDPDRKILLTGNYGLPDTARVVPQK